MIVAIVVLLAFTLPMAFSDAWGDDGVEETDGAEYGKLVIASSSASGIYDGTPLTSVEWHLVEGTLEKGHTLSVNVSGTQTNVGVSDNHIIATVFDANMKNVTAKYEIEYKMGQLEVKPREICVIANSAMKLYDGSPLTAYGHTLQSAASLLPKHTIEVDVKGKLFDVGMCDNVVDFVAIYDENKEDVTANYHVTTVNGTLVIYEEDTLVFESGSDTKRYDGVPLICSLWELSIGTLPEGITASAEVTGIQKEVGKSENAFTVKLFNEEDVDVTSQFKILCVPGVLTVIPGELVIKSNDAMKIYDGEALVDDGFTVSPLVLQTSGLAFEVVITGEQTEIGTSENTIEGVTVKDENGNDVTKYFTVITENGVLTVTDENGVAPGGQGGLTGDLSGDGNTIPDNTVVFKLSSNTNDNVYLKMMSYGDFNETKNGWKLASAYGEKTFDGKSGYYMTSLALNNSGLKTTALAVDPVGGYFALPYYAFNGDFNIQTSDVMITGYSTSSYTVNYFNWDDVAGVTVPPKYASYESAYSQYVTDTYTTVDIETYNFMQDIIREQSFSASDDEIIGKVARYIQNAAEYNLDYKTEMDNESNVVIAFLSEYKEGVCRHYASAATLLYRSLGIPARYTVGFLGKTTAGSVTEVTAAQAHAWVEVYVNGIGWVNVEVTGSSPSSSAPIELTITPTYTGELNVGQTLQATQSVTGFEELANEGYTYEVSISGSRRGLGISKSRITHFRIYNPWDKLVYDKSTGLGNDKFRITFEQGNIQLYISHLIFTSADREKLYDGTPLAGSLSDCILSDGMCEFDDSITVIPSATITNVGKVSNSYNVRVLRNGTNVTDYYRITKNYGYLTVTAREITVTAGSETKPFDGTPLVCDKIDYSASVLAVGDRIDSYVVEGSQTNIGESVNVIRSIVIKNQKGQDVTSNYSIKIKDGLLKVTVPQ